MSLIWMFLIFTVTLGMDQYTKWLVASQMELYESIPVISNVFHFTYVRNSGAAWGILPNQTTFFVIVSIVAIIGLCVFYYRNQELNNALTAVAVSLICSGAIGNMIDRVKDGSVVDFFDVRIFPIFNIADIAICVGVGLFLIDTYIQELAIQKRAESAAEAPSSSLPTAQPMMVGQL